MKKKEAISKEYVVHRLSQVVGELKLERHESQTTIAQLGKAGKYHLRLSDQDMERIERYFRGRVTALQLAENLVNGVIKNVLDDK